MVANENVFDYRRIILVQNMNFSIDSGHYKCLRIRLWLEGLFTEISRTGRKRQSSRCCIEKFTMAIIMWDRNFFLINYGKLSHFQTLEKMRKISRKLYVLVDRESYGDLCWMEMNIRSWDFSNSYKQIWIYLMRSFKPDKSEFYRPDILRDWFISNSRLLFKRILGRKTT